MITITRLNEVHYFKKMRKARPTYGTSANRASIDMEAPYKVAYCSDLHPFTNLLHMQMVVAFGFGALFGMRTEEVANLTWERVLFDVERIILDLKGLHAITLAGGFDKVASAEFNETYSPSTNRRKGL
jgi:integrase